MFDPAKGSGADSTGRPERCELREVELPFVNPASVRITVNERPLLIPISVEPVSFGVSTRVSTVPSRNGLYEIVGLEDGSYRARIADGSTEYQAEFRVPSQPTEIAVQLHEARIRLSDSNGAGVRGEIRIERGEPRRPKGRRTWQTHACQNYGNDGG